MRTFIILLLIVLPNFIFSQNTKSKSQSDSYIAVIKTALGNIEILLFDDTPLHRDNFIKMAKMGAFDSTIFHRVIKNFVIQGGDPNTKPKGMPEKLMKLNPPLIPAEFRPEHKHIIGAVAAARTGDNVNPKKMSSPFQFYIVLNEERTAHLNGSYTVFGQVISGMDVVYKISNMPTGPGDKPLENIYMRVEIKKLN
jgi:cyclophilin family peptidyl-prolyl cis-trans isomerase